ncbi:Sterol 14-alpha demethylase [Xylographa parallela]|nr:Sterol 14-alpha demethylase [Xylographa parallela]
MAGLEVAPTNFLERIPLAVSTSIMLVVGTVFWTVLQQLFFRKAHEPPMVFHWFPLIGSAVTYGQDPVKFFSTCQAKYGDIFTFILLGRKITVYLGAKGNDFILNGKHKDMNAEEIYSVLTTPIFGKGVIYDCPNSMLMEQKKFVKGGLTTDALRSHVPLMEQQVNDYIQQSPNFKGSSGVVDFPPIMAEITLFTASRSLQGKEVREKLDSSFAQLYHDLDDAFTPLNFMLPWAPLPHNKRRDIARDKMTQIYADIMEDRRKKADGDESQDLISNLMRCVYKDGRSISDEEIAHLMMALLMAGQHSSSVTSSWISLHLAAEPAIAEELYKEQLEVLGNTSAPLTYEGLQNLKLNTHVVRETLRLHPPIHSIMRKVKNPLPVEGTDLVVPPSHVLLAAPGFMAVSAAHFPDPQTWNPHRWDCVDDLEADAKRQVDYGFGMVSASASSPYLPFGAGRHRCIGEQYAYVQLTTILALMVRNFTLRNVEGKKGVVGTDYSSLFSRPLAPAVIHWEKRRGSGK